MHFEHVSKPIWIRHECELQWCTYEGKRGRFHVIEVVSHEAQRQIISSAFVCERSRSRWRGRMFIFGGLVLRGK